MNKSLIIALVLASILCAFLPMPSPGAVQEYMNDLGVTPVKVASSTPLPVTLKGAATVSPTDPGILVNGNTGPLGSATLSIPLGATVALPTAPANARNCLIFPTQDVNYGNTSVSSGTDHPFFFQLVPGQGFFNCVNFTGWRLIGRTAVATATILWY